MRIFSLFSLLVLLGGPCVRLAAQTPVAVGVIPSQNFNPGGAPVTIDLHTQSYRFQKGHRVMVQVQSSWFPIIDRNPQTWVPNIFDAKASDFKAQTHRVWRTTDAASKPGRAPAAPNAWARVIPGGKGSSS